MNLLAFAYPGRHLIGRAGSASDGGMGGVCPRHTFGLAGAFDVQVDDDRVLAATGNHALQRLVVEGVDLLVWHKRRDVDETARACLVGVLQSLTPTHPGPAAEDVDDAFEFAVMVRTGPRARIDGDRPGPQLLRPDPVVRNRGGAIHARGLWCVEIQRIGRDDHHALRAPVWVGVRFHGHAVEGRTAAGDLRAGGPSGAPVGPSFAIADNQSGNAVGSIGLWLQNLSLGRARIGYAVSP